MAPRLPILELTEQVQGMGIVPASGQRAMAQATQQIGQEISGVGAALDQARSRHDYVNRARSKGDYRKIASDEFRRMSLEDDMSNPEAVRAFDQFLQERQRDLVNEHGGSADSNALLAGSLEDMRSLFLGEATAAHLKRADEMIDTMLGESMAPLAAMAAADPGSSDRAMSEWRAIVDEARDATAISDAHSEAIFKAGQSHILKSELEGLLDLGATDEVERRLGNEGVAAALGPDNARRIQSRATVTRFESERPARELNANLRAIEGALGPLTPEQKADYVRSHFGMKTGGEGVPSFIENLRWLQKMGIEVSEESVIKMAGGHVAEGADMFGTGTRGRALEHITNLAPLYEAGLTTPAQERLLESSVTHYQEEFPHPDTGEMVRPRLPEFAVQALQSREGGDALPSQAIQRVPGSIQLGTGESIPSTGVPAPSGAPPPAETVAEVPAGTPSLWERAGNVSGPIPTLAEKAGQTPIVGTLLGSQQMTQNRGYARGLTNDLVRVLQNSPKFAMMEWGQIRKEVDLDPGIYDTEAAYKDRMIAIDDILEERKQDAIKTINNRTMIGKDDYQRALTLLNDIGLMQQRLGVPRRVKSVEEARKLVSEGALRSGEQFVDPDGNIRQVP